MRIAFFGGSFDPPHLGHLAIARAAADRLALNQVLFAPVGSQPLKAGLALAGYPDRLAMVTLATSADPRFIPSTLDQPRPDGSHNYTYDTLAAFKASLGLATRHPENQLYCLLGADSFQTLHHWHRAADLLRLCDFIIAARPGYPLDRIDAGLPPGIAITGRPSPTQFQLAGATTLHLLPDLDEDVSATALRQALAQGDTAASNPVLPPGVAAYIQTHHLYRDPAGVLPT
jgi:nicotinate-nucleotide adenylyltransferase